jgi:4a-hydroxytetrahydrobiopterin dehydratase
MTTPLSESEIAHHLSRISSWERSNGEISRRFEFADFAASMRFVNAVANLAEKANHHPDIDIRWNKVFLRLSTHSAGGLTDLDFALAEQINALG